MTKLLPCPFCKSTRLDIQREPNQWIPWFHVYCDSPPELGHDCHARGPARRSMAEAIAAWNTRAPVAITDAMIEAAATIREQAAEIERLRARVAAKTSTAKFKALLKAAEPSQ